MSIDLRDQIKEMQEERNISEELVIATISKVVKDAYEKQFGTTENCEVEIVDGHLRLLAHKSIVLEEDLEDPATQIPLVAALTLVEGCEVGDELIIDIDPTNLGQRAVNVGKQRGRQDFKEIQKDSLYSEYKSKEGQLIQGYIQRTKDDNVFVDIGRTEGILPKRFQSPKESHTRGDRIKILVWEVRREGANVHISLSRSHPEFVKRICEIEIPEINEGTVQIDRIVREPGYRTKIAVSAPFANIEPVGACVGQKGIRVQNIINEIGGERIDILTYSPDPQVFMKNALSPAKVSAVYILDHSKQKALAIVEDSQLALAIGKNGQNIRLANKMVGWVIDVKTESQAMEENLLQDDSEYINDIFNQGEEISDISDLNDLGSRVIQILKDNGIELIESLISLDSEDLHKIDGLTQEDIERIVKIIDDSVEIIDENLYDETFEEDTKINDLDLEILEPEIEEETISKEEIEYHCPECDFIITLDMNTCPNCGIGFIFDEVDEEENEE